MSLYGPVEILLVAMLSPFSHGRFAVPLALFSSTVLLVAAFWSEGSSIFGVPADYATIGMRLPTVVFDDLGWLGLAVWTAAAATFVASLGLWELLLTKELHASQTTVSAWHHWRRLALFTGANFLVPTISLPIFLTIFLADLEVVLIKGWTYLLDSDKPDLVLLDKLSWHQFLLVAALSLPITWLFLRLAIWPTIVLKSGWRYSLRRAWRASRGLAPRFLCFLLGAPYLVLKIFDLVAYALHEMEWGLVDQHDLGKAVLLATSGNGVICTVLLGFWISAVMALHLPAVLVEQKPTFEDVF